MATEFLGEHLLPGQLGHFFIILSFVASAFSTFTYFKAAQTELKDPSASKAWLKLGRNSFVIHTLAILGTFSALYYIITRHLFEYNYAWSHSSYDLPMQYLLSCFWEGQEGSFMLWMFWHSILGLFIMRSGKDLESRTMSIIALVQAILGTMILGIVIGQDIKIGSTPFLLLRHAMQGAPIFAMPNYMSFIKDGNGLNISLQNYWMVIHPPVLFLGFALTLIPFAYCIAALWKGEYKSFVKPTIIWSLAGGAILGTGIIMGGAWAYESLNFGGYWAWDPVENASLVPWLTLIAGLHTLLIYRSTKRAFFVTMFFLLITHLLVWYSTFLTRTGILGKTSVHAFTGDGEALFYHLLTVIGILLVLSIVALWIRRKGWPVIKTEETTLSREFWMFIGSAVLFISATMIAIQTSMPVWSPIYKMFTGKEPAPPVDIMSSYNNKQVWIAIIIGLLSGMVLYMKYKQTTANKYWKSLIAPTVISLAFTLFIGWGQSITTWQYSIMLFSSCFALVSAVSYAISVQKLKIRNLGPSVSHLGFAAVLLGILLSSYNKHAISLNTMGISFGFNKDNPEEDARESRENQLMFLNTKVAMGEYVATYLGDSAVPGKDKRVYYKVKFEKIDSATKQVKESFMLYPDAFINPKGNMGGLSANPSTKHYITKDIFTFINQASDKSKKDTSTYHSHVVKPGDTIFLNRCFVVFDKIEKNYTGSKVQLGANDIAVSPQLSVYGLEGKIKEMHPVYVIQNQQDIKTIEDTTAAMAIYARLEKIVLKDENTAEFDIMIRQTAAEDDFIVLKALVFPYINVLWIGVIIMVFGFFISIGKLANRKTKDLEEELA